MNHDREDSSSKDQDALGIDFRLLPSTSVMDHSTSIPSSNDNDMDHNIAMTAVSKASSGNNLSSPLAAENSDDTRSNESSKHSSKHSSKQNTNASINLNMDSNMKVDSNGSSNVHSKDTTVTMIETSKSDNGGNNVIADINTEIDTVGLKTARVLGILLILFLGLLFFAGVYFGLWYLVPSYVESLAFQVSYIIFIINTLYLLVIVYYYYIKEKFISEKDSDLFRRNRFRLILILSDKFGMIKPAMAHFGDTATDIAVLIEFYMHSTIDFYGYVTNGNTESKEVGYEGSMINYNDLFWLTLSVIVFYRTFSCIIVYNYSKSYCNMLLQFLDVYLFKLVFISVEKGYSEAPPIQKYIQYLESLFESAPQALITLYVITAKWIFMDEWPSITLSFAAFVSLYNIINRSNDEDRLVIENCRYKQLNYRCFKSLVCCRFNVSCVLRVIWRFCDIISNILILILVGIISDISTMLLVLLLSIVFASIYPMIRLYLTSNMTYIIDEIALFNILIQTPIAHKRSDNGIISTYYGIIRIIINVLLFISVYYFDYITFIVNSDSGLRIDHEFKREFIEFTVLYCVALLCFCINIIYYTIHFISEFNVCCLSSHFSCVRNISMFEPLLITSIEGSMEHKSESCDSLIGSGITSSLPRTLVTCKNMDEVKNIYDFEYATSLSDVTNIETWINFVDPLALMETLLLKENRKHFNKNINHMIDMTAFSNWVLFKALWVGIFSNPVLSEKDINYWNKLLEMGQFDGKNCHYQSDELIDCCIKSQRNAAMIVLFLEKYNANGDRKKLVKFVEKQDDGICKTFILPYLTPKEDKNKDTDKDQDGKEEKNKEKDKENDDEIVKDREIEEEEKSKDRKDHSKDSNNSNNSNNSNEKYDSQADQDKDQDQVQDQDKEQQKQMINENVLETENLYDNIMKNDDDEDEDEDADDSVKKYEHSNETDVARMQIYTAQELQDRISAHGAGPSGDHLDGVKEDADFDEDDSSSEENGSAASDDE